MEGEDIRRSGVMGLRAQVNSLRHKLAAAEAEAERAREDARQLAAFIEGRADLPVWHHADVAALLDLTFQALSDEVAGAARRAAATGTPASHVLYGRITDKARERAAERLREALEGGMARPDLLTQEMRDDLLRRVGAKLD